MSSTQSESVADSGVTPSQSQVSPLITDGSATVKIAGQPIDQVFNTNTLSFFAIFFIIYYEFLL